MASKKPTVAELTKQVDQMRAALAAIGVRISDPLPVEPDEMADFVAFGSDAHAALQGLMEVTDPDDLPDGIPTYKSRKTSRVWRLIDSTTPFMGMPDPMTQAAMVLRQKVRVLDAGEPKVHADAPTMWTPPPIAQ